MLQGQVYNNQDVNCSAINHANGHGDADSDFEQCEVSICRDFEGPCLTDTSSNVQRTILKTVTSTAVSQATSIQTSTNTAQTTIIVPKTLTATEIITT
jgi:hypothetical protein